MSQQDIVAVASKEDIVLLIFVAQKPLTVV